MSPKKRATPAPDRSPSLDTLAEEAKERRGRGRPPLDPSEPRRKFWSRAFDDEVLAWGEAAARAGQPLAAWVRHMCNLGARNG